VGQFEPGAGEGFVKGLRIVQETAGNFLEFRVKTRAGPDNPMGLYALYIGRLYAIHGTNANFGIGLRVSHGCVRLRNDDIKFLFENVPVGTRVQFINEPVKATSEPDGSRYLEVHNPLSTSEDQIDNNVTVPITLKSNVQAIASQADVDTTVVDQAIQNRSGMPVRLN
jgi:L,D-transpeptidase YbiS